MYHDHVGNLARLERAYLVEDAERLSAVAGGRQQRFAVWQAGIHEELKTDSVVAELADGVGAHEEAPRSHLVELAGHVELPFLLPVKVRQVHLFARAQGALFTQLSQCFQPAISGLNRGAEPGTVLDHTLSDPRVEAPRVVHFDKLVVLNAVEISLERIGYRLRVNGVDGTRSAMPVRFVGDRAQLLQSVRVAAVVGDVGTATRSHHLDEIGAFLDQTAHGASARLRAVGFFVAEVEMPAGDGDAASAGVQCRKSAEELGADPLLEIQSDPVARAGIAHGGDASFEQMKVAIAHAAQQHERIAVNLVDLVVRLCAGHAAGGAIHQVHVGVHHAGHDTAVGEVQHACIRRGRG